MDRLNYHHLRYFHAVAQTGNLTRTAELLNVSQSALSSQIRDLEARLGHDLFAREGRGLVLTEAGRIALDHAERIFGAGAELLAVLSRRGAARRSLRVGALSTLSRNFQLRFLRPVLEHPEVDLVLRSGSAAVLFDGLAALDLDVVLSTDAPPRRADLPLVAHRIAEQRVGLYGAPARLNHPTLAALLQAEPLILPTESSIRTGFDSLVARLGLTPRIAAEVDDMAMVRLLAREGSGVAIAPEVALADELAQGILRAAPFPLDVVESFYAITLARDFPHPMLAELLAGQPF
jgi:LysR family transcriptional activator of nhaA